MVNENPPKVQWKIIGYSDTPDMAEQMTKLLNEAENDNFEVIKIGDGLIFLARVISDDDDTSQPPQETLCDSCSGNQEGICVKRDIPTPFIPKCPFFERLEDGKKEK